MYMQIGQLIKLNLEDHKLESDNCLDLGVLDSLEKFCTKYMVDDLTFDSLSLNMHSYEILFHMNASYYMFYTLCLHRCVRLSVNELYLAIQTSQKFPFICWHVTRCGYTHTFILRPHMIQCLHVLPCFTSDAKLLLFYVLVGSWKDISMC